MLSNQGLFPGISFFLSGWYKRKESSKRISLFFVGAVLAGAFGGILGCEFHSRLRTTRLTLAQSVLARWTVLATWLAGHGL